MKYEEKIYTMYDTVTKDCVAVMKAKNDKDLVRMMVFCGYFKVNRLEDTEVYDTGVILDNDCKGLVLSTENSYKKLNVKELLKELSIEVENKAEEIDKEEMKEKLEKTRKGGN